MANKNARGDGGPAFPFYFPAAASYESCDGMTLRDYFAAKALAAIVKDAGGDVHNATAARLAYEAADAMLVERLK